MDARTMGGASSINAVASVIPSLRRRCYDNAQSREGDALQEAVNQMRPEFKALPAIPALGTIVADMLNDPAWTTVRPPFGGLSEAQVESVRTAMAQSGLLEHLVA